MPLTKLRDIKKTVAIIESRIQEGTSADPLKDLSFLSEQYAARREWDKANAATRHMVDLAEGKEDSVFEITPYDLDYHQSQHYTQKHRARKCLRILGSVYGLLIALLFGSIYHRENPSFLSNLRCAVLVLDPQSFIDRADMRIGDLVEVLADYETALRLAPSNKKAIAGKAGVLFSMGNLKDAQRFNELTDHESPEYWRIKAAIEYRQGSLLKAAEYSHMVARASKEIDDYLSETSLWSLCGKHEAALQSARNAVSLSKSDYDKSNAYCGLARCLKNLGRNDECMAACNKSLESYKHGVIVNTLKAEVLTENGQYSEAVLAASHALQYSRFFGRALAARAAALERLGRTTDAAADRRMIETYGNHAVDNI